MLLISLLALLQLSCSETIPNSEVCADKGILGAHCAWTLAGNSRNISKLAWDKERIGDFCLNSKDFGKYQEFILKSCQMHNDCVQEVNQFISKVQGN